MQSENGLKPAWYGGIQAFIWGALAARSHEQFRLEQAMTCRHSTRPSLACCVAAECYRVIRAACIQVLMSTSVGSHDGRKPALVQPCRGAHPAKWYLELNYERELRAIRGLAPARLTASM